MIEKHEVRLHTGVRLRYADVGPRNGDPLILLHGFSDSSLSFDPVLGLLPTDLRLIIPDQRGHGESGCPPHGYTPHEFAMDAIALLDAVAVRSAAVVGHSLGSFVTQRMAVLAPHRVSKLVLVGSAATSYNETLVDLARAISSLSDPVDLEFVREFQTS
jgi:pimeloyl-ACP methyl ester carboxylesterase